MRHTLLLVGILLISALAGLVPLALRVSPVEAATTVITVTQTSDESDLSPGDGHCDVSATAGEQCTLRAAIQEANTTDAPDTIAFNIPGDGVHVIRPGSRMPRINTPLTIDGYTQPGASPNTLAVGTNAVLRIELDGSNYDGDRLNFGLEIRAPTVVVRGLAINRFSSHAILVSHLLASGVRIEGCFIGTDAAGTQVWGTSTASISYLSPAPPSAARPPPPVTSSPATHKRVFSSTAMGQAPSCKAT